mmetsp:Transcript_7515/g.22259  ORF Transcript_7515/g.22259 Transcript_7515/m.22259 type:complete len:360 (-) Transcript_7515:338-1417(-)
MAAQALREVMKDAGAADNMRPPIVCPGHTRPLAEVSFSPETGDGYFLISGCLDGAPMLRDASTGDWIGTFSGHKGAVWSARLCAEARLAATGSGDFSAKVWDACTGKELASLDHKHVVKCVDFSADRSTLATAGVEGLLRLYDVEAGLGDSGPFRVFETRLDGKKPASINKCVFLPAGLIAIGSADGRVAVLDPRVDGDAPVSVTDLTDASGQHSEPVMDLEFTAGALGPTLTVAAGERVHLLDGARFGAPRKPPIDCPVHFREEGGATLRPDGKELVLGGGRHGGSRQGALGVAKGATKVGDVGSDLAVHVVDVDKGVVSHQRKGHCGPVRCLRYHPDGQHFATGSEDGTIRLWDVAD